MQLRINITDSEHSVMEVALTLQGRPKTDLPKFIAVQAAVNEAAAVVARKADKASE